MLGVGGYQIRTIPYVFSSTAKGFPKLHAVHGITTLQQPYNRRRPWYSFAFPVLRSRTSWASSEASQSPSTPQDVWLAAGDEAVGAWTRLWELWALSFQLRMPQHGEVGCYTTGDTKRGAPRRSEHPAICLCPSNGQSWPWGSAIPQRCYPHALREIPRTWPVLCLHLKFCHQLMLHCRPRQPAYSKGKTWYTVTRKFRVIGTGNQQRPEITMMWN